MVAKASVVYLTIGPPGSGKSTFVSTLAKIDKPVVICPDEIREQFFGDRSNMSNDNFVWAHAYALLQKAISEKKNVVFDATFVRPKYRREVIRRVRQAEETKAHVIGVIFTTPMETCKARNLSRAKETGITPVPDDVIEKMWNTLNDNPPSLDEGFDDLTYIEEYNDKSYSHSRQYL